MNHDKMQNPRTTPDEVEIASRDSFPASDPPSWIQGDLPEDRDEDALAEPAPLEERRTEAL